jgi:hypothetical protein
MSFRGCAGSRGAVHCTSHAPSVWRPPRGQSSPRRRPALDVRTSVLEPARPFQVAQNRGHTLSCSSTATPRAPCAMSRCKICCPRGTREKWGGSEGVGAWAARDLFSSRIYARPGRYLTLRFPRATQVEWHGRELMARSRGACSIRGTLSVEAPLLSMPPMHTHASLETASF